MLYVPMCLNHLPGIQNPSPVEHALDLPHQAQFRFGKNNVEIGSLHQADAVFAGNGAAFAFYKAENLANTLWHFHVPAVVVEVAFEDIDVQIAIARVAIADRLEAVSRTHFFYFF